LKNFSDEVTLFKKMFVYCTAYFCLAAILRDDGDTVGRLQDYYVLKSKINI
jgi:hypothetical protein